MLLLNLLFATANAGVYTQTEFVNNADPTRTLSLELDIEHSGEAEGLQPTQGISSILSLLPSAKRKRRKSPNIVTKYIQLRNLTTVNQAWQEYNYGVNGNPSVEFLVNNYGTNWLTSRADFNFYYSRKNIYGHITKAIENGKNEDEAVNELETLRVEQGWTLNKLQDSIGWLNVDESSGKLQPAIPLYQLLPNLTTVPEVWQEYKYGINGSQSIESLVKAYGRKWHPTKANELRYYRRKTLYDFLDKTINSGKSEVESVNELEELRESQNWSLSNLELNIPTLSIDEESGKPIPSTQDYRFVRNLTTVPQVWEEYKVGINGKPSVESLVQEFGIGWLSSSSERRYYYSRKKIYDYIMSPIHFPNTENFVVNKLEQLRLENHWTLSKLQKHITSLMVEKIPSLQAVSVYKLFRNLTTVPEVWQEFKYGLNGNPSVESLLIRYKINWLQSHSDRQLYYKRKKIYDSVKNAVAKGQTENEAVNDLEALRIAKHWSLSVLQMQNPQKSYDFGSNGTQSRQMDGEDMDLFSEIISLLE